MLYLKALFWASEAEGRGFDPRQPRQFSPSSTSHDTPQGLRRNRPAEWGNAKAEP